ncbi:MAG: histidine triad nucleotide-binding protein [Candidatus Eremiobacteraeota bacterium]|nr:histidine triad nucleotide-binding protein [Candidatus Eremiobacteraeota bacterium]
MKCIFCSIIKGEIPSKRLYEDDKIVCFHDISPQAPVHILIVPRKHFPDLLAMSAEEGEYAAHLIKAIPLLAKKAGLESEGFRLVSNCKEKAGQSVFHLHFHLMGGRSFTWPPG